MCVHHLLFTALPIAVSKQAATRSTEDRKNDIGICKYEALRRLTGIGQDNNIDKYRTKKGSSGWTSDGEGSRRTRRFGRINKDYAIYNVR